MGGIPVIVVSLIWYSSSIEGILTGPVPVFCGVSNSSPFSDRIVGGLDSDPHEFPWLVKIYYNDHFHCGGSLITDRHVVSAGHCVTEWQEGSSPNPRRIRGNVTNRVLLDPEAFIIEVGAFLSNETAANVTKREVLEIFLHQDYDVFLIKSIMIQTNDIAVMKFTPVVFTHNIAPICLPPKDSEVPDGATLMVAGWGNTKTETFEHPVTLMPNNTMKTEINKIPFATCKANKNVGWLLTEVNGLTERELFCGMGNNTDGCRGDSGGPAMMKTPKGVILSGIISWGLGCNQPNYPAGYVRVSTYVDFIRSRAEDGMWLPHPSHLT